MPSVVILRWAGQQDVVYPFMQSIKLLVNPRRHALVAILKRFDPGVIAADLVGHSGGCGHNPADERDEIPGQLAEYANPLGCLLG